MIHSIFKFLAATSISVMMGLPAYACDQSECRQEVDRDKTLLGTDKYDRHYSLAFKVSEAEQHIKRLESSLKLCRSRYDNNETFNVTKDMVPIDVWYAPTDTHLNLSDETLTEQLSKLRSSKYPVRHGNRLKKRGFP